MSRISVYSRGRNVGSAEFSGMDPGLGNAAASFAPAGDYAEIRSIVSDYTRLRAQRRNDDEFRQAQRRYENLGLSVKTMMGAEIRPSGGVLIEDAGGSCRITLVGLSPIDREKLFQ
jgi:hypothetical protein